jgi:hypothetical protein
VQQHEHGLTATAHSTPSLPRKIVPLTPQHQEQQQQLGDASHQGGRGQHQHLPACSAGQVDAPDQSARASGAGQSPRRGGARTTVLLQPLSNGSTRDLSDNKPHQRPLSAEPGSRPASFGDTVNHNNASSSQPRANTPAWMRGASATIKAAALASDDRLPHAPPISTSASSSAPTSPTRSGELDPLSSSEDYSSSSARSSPAASPSVRQDKKEARRQRKAQAKVMAKATLKHLRRALATPKGALTTHATAAAGAAAGAAGAAGVAGAVLWVLLELWALLELRLLLLRVLLRVVLLLLLLLLLLLPALVVALASSCCALWLLRDASPPSTRNRNCHHAAPPPARLTN